MPVEDALDLHRKRMRACGTTQEGYVEKFGEIGTEMFITDLVRLTYLALEMRGESVDENIVDAVIRGVVASATESKHE